MKSASQPLFFVGCVCMCLSARHFGGRRRGFFYSDDSGFCLVIRFCDFKRANFLNFECVPCISSAGAFFGVVVFCIV